MKIPYVCPNCRASFPDSLALTHHLADKHNPLLGQGAATTAAINRTPMDILPVAINEYRCVRCVLTFDGYADMWHHYRDHHAPRMVTCTACLADLTPGPGQRLDVAFGRIAQHFDSHHDPKALQHGTEWSLNMPASVDQLHSAGFKTIEQEFFELSAMRGGTILDLAMDLVEEYVVSRNSDWLEVLIYVKDQMAARAKECAGEKRDVIFSVHASNFEDSPF